MKKVLFPALICLAFLAPLNMLKAQNPGQINNYLLVSELGSDEHSGYCVDSAFKTIAKALEIAELYEISNIRILEGTYEETVYLKEGINILGRFDLKGEECDTCSTIITGSQDQHMNGHVVAVYGKDIKHETHVSGICIRSKDAIYQANSITGTSSYGIFLDSVSGLYLDDITIYSGKAGDGNDGEDGVSILELAASGMDGEDGYAVSSNCNTYKAPGGAGGASSEYSGGAGGNGGSRDTKCTCLFGECTCLPSGCNATAGTAGSAGGGLDYGVGGPGGSSCSHGTDGGPGGDGANGTNGANGSNELNSFNLDTDGFWVPTIGSQGSFGSHGSGGGGGGGGGGCDDGTDTNGASGGGGGAGGLRGTPGTAAQSGGSSFGIFARNTFFFAEDLEIYGGIGGNGGEGGKGGKGQPGGEGGEGGIIVSSGNDGDAGDGGKGGDGGDSGDGGNGAGGSAFISFLYHTSKVGDITVKDRGTVGSGGGDAADGDRLSFAGGEISDSSFISPASQTIDFTISQDTIFIEDLPIQLLSDASSGMPVVFSVSPAIASIRNDSLFAQDAGEIIVTASQHGNIHFLPVSKSQTLLLLKKPHYCYADTITEEVCVSYVGPGGDVWTESGVYIDTVVYAEGCDSIFVINLTINQVETEVSQSGGVLSAVAQSAVYQWLNCDQDYAIIDGETNQSFAPSVNGNYAVEVTQGDCKDTSSCKAVTNVGILENTFASSVLIYPNPTAGSVTIELGQLYHDLTISVSSSSGQLISTERKDAADKFSIDLEGHSGIYMVCIETARGERTVIKVIKE